MKKALSIVLPNGEFIKGGWVAPPHEGYDGFDGLKEEFFADVKKSGVNLLFPVINPIADPLNFERFLSLCDQYDIYTLVPEDGLGTETFDFESFYKRLEKYKKHKSVFGINLWDEPGIDRFPIFGKNIEKIKPYINGMMLYINNMPNQNVYLTDPHPRAYSSSLNNLKYYGDCRREQMVTVHNKYFVPYTAFSNCEYYAFKHSRVDDSEFFEYSFLQGLAVTPNICLGEMRTFFERTSSKRLPYVKAFIKKWLRFVRENIDCWRHVYQLGDCPGAGANEAYAHINGNRGFVCLVNQNASTNTFSFDLDWSIGLKGKNDDRFILSEVYPEERFIAEQSLPGPLYGETITLSVPAHSVRFVKIEPYYEEPNGIRLYGIAGKIKQEEEAYTVQFSAESGACVESAVWLSDRAVADVNVETKKTVRKYYFPSSVTDCKIAGCCARFIVNAPREYFNREINRWHVDNSEESYILSYAGSDFCGGFIHNLYKERQNMILSVGYRKEQTKESLKALPYIYNTVGEKQVPKRRARVYSTKLEIPFIENPTMANGYGHDEVLELVFRDSLSIKSLRAFIDKKPVKIFEYKYPSNPEMKAFYIELIGEVRSGTSPCLKLEVEWNSETKKRETTYGETKEGAQVIG